VNEKIEKTTILAVYSAFVAACYLAAYWSRFDVNIFQFAGITGFASLALYPLMTAFSLNVMVLLILPRRSTKSNPTAAHKFTRVLFRTIYIIWTVCGPAAALVAYELMTDPFKWMIIMVGIVPIIHQSADLPIVEGIAKDPQRRKDVLYWAVAFPFLAALAGGLNAQTILDGRETRVIEAAGAAKNLQVDQDHPVAFLGFSGGTYFLYESKSGNVIMVNQAVAEPLIFQPRLQKNQPVELPKWVKSIFHH
jgi:hypothetical protein